MIVDSAPWTVDGNPIMVQGTWVEAVWHEVYALVEKGMVMLKVARFSIGETE